MTYLQKIMLYPLVWYYISLGSALTLPQLPVRHMDGNQRKPLTHDELQQEADKIKFKLRKLVNKSNNLNNDMHKKLDGNEAHFNQIEASYSGKNISWNGMTFGTKGLIVFGSIIGIILLLVFICFCCSPKRFNQDYDGDSDSSDSESS